jgi:hypothetical protein
MVLVFVRPLLTALLHCPFRDGDRKPIVHAAASSLKYFQCGRWFKAEQGAFVVYEVELYITPTRISCQVRWAAV